jgi:hypothetical protein
MQYENFETGYFIMKLKDDIIEGLNWLDKDLVEWSAELNNIDETINRHKEIIE